jgi:CRISPR-associated protein Cmr4
MNPVLFLYTETSLHAGTGSTASVVDLPIQRERTTQLPMVAGSGVKGALRAQYTGDGEVTLFGPDNRNADAHAGAISIGDARIVLFPVQALSDVFAFATSPLALSRLKRLAPGLPCPVPPQSKALVNSASSLITGARVVLEEFSFDAQKSPDVDALATWLSTHALPQGEEYAYWREKLSRSLIVLPDADFRDFCRNSTEISTRVRLERGSKTVATGALWTEERLPADCLLAAPVLIGSARDKSGWSAEDIAQALGQGIAPRIQLGGDETTGSGFVAVRWL